MVRLRVVVTNYLSIFPKVSIPKWCDCESSNELFKYFSKSFNSKMVRLRELAGSKSLLMKMFQFQNGAIASRKTQIFNLLKLKDLTRIYSAILPTKSRRIPVVQKSRENDDSLIIKGLRTFYSIYCS